MPSSRASGWANRPVRPAGWTGMPCRSKAVSSSGYAARDRTSTAMSRYRRPSCRKRTIVVAIRSDSSASVSADQLTTSTSDSSRTAAIVFGRRPGMDSTNAAAAATMPGRLRRFVVMRNVRDVRVALDEVNDVAHVGAAPLVDRLVVVSDNAHLDLGSSKQLDEGLLGGVDVLVLVDDQVAQVSVDDRGDRRVTQRLDRATDLLPVGE